MKTPTQQQTQKAAQDLKDVSTDAILNRIRQLDNNLDTLRSDRITIIALPEFKKVKATRDLLAAVLKFR